MMQHISINGRLIGEGQKPYIIAELSANHNGSIDRAFETIEMAAAMGASAVKIQSYTADTMTINCDKSDFIIRGGLWDGYSLFDLYNEAGTPYEWHESLFKKAREVGITLFSTPFDETAVDLLESLDAPAYKIASFEITDLQLIKYVAETGKPLIMSTGLATEAEIEEAVSAAIHSGGKQIILLHCISSYPSPDDQSNVATVPLIKERFGVPVGLSDHTMGTAVSVAAVALGACVIEKHVTMSRSLKGPDSAFSLEPEELKALCKDTEIAWLARGIGSFDRKPSEEANLCFRRSIYFVKDIAAGEKISPEHIRRIRPGYGLAPKYFDQLIGKTVKRDIPRGTATTWEQINE